MSDIFDLLLKQLEELEQQDRAGINPEREDIDHLFQLAKSARRRRAENAAARGDTAPVDATDRVSDADVALVWRRGASASLARTLAAVDAVEDVVRTAKPRRMRRAS